MIHTEIYYIVLFVILVALELLYMGVARRFKIGAKVTPRSSHSRFTITGGGIIFIIAGLGCRIGTSYTGISDELPATFDLMLMVGSALALMSFIDDIRGLEASTRLVIQALLLSITFSYLMEPSHFDVFPVVLIMGVGFVNAYNFMDGITGMLAAYSLVSLGSLYAAYQLLPEVDYGMLVFIATLFIAVFVFAIFNFRPKAMVFCGDVGAIVMGFFIFYITVNLMVKTHNASYAIMFIVYGVDTIFTIFERLFKGEHILTSHHSHLYQALACKWGLRHRVISSIYACTQLGINVMFLIIPDKFRWSYDIIVTCLLTALYFILKNTPRLRRCNSNYPPHANLE